LHLVGILFPHINEDARTKSHQTYYHDNLKFHIITLTKRILRFVQASKFT